MNLTNQKAALASAFIVGAPIDQAGRIAALETALLADEALLFGTNNACTPTDLSAAQLATPATPVITNGGTAGASTWTYLIADISNVGEAPSAAGSTTTGNATLTPTNFNIVSFTAIPGHTYEIYRTVAATSPTSIGLIGTMTIALNGSVNQVFNDTGIAAATAQPPTVNTTGSAAVAGNLFLNGVALKGCNFTTINNAAGVTLTAVQVVAAAMLLRTGAVAVSDQMPTAAALVAAMPGVKVNQGFELYIRNANTGTLTLTTNTGITLAAGNTNTIATVHVKKLLFVFTNVTYGAEAVTVYTLEDTAY